MMNEIPRNIKERRALISYNASVLYDKGRYRTDKDRWLAAEKEIDSKIFQSSRKLSEYYSSFMIKFFSSVDHDQMSDLEMAKSFFLFSADNEALLSVLCDGKRADLGMRNVSIAVDDSEFIEISKKALLLANTTLIGHNKDSVPRRQIQWTFKGSDPEVGTDIVYYAHCQSLESVGKWLRDFSKLLQTGDIFYFPSTNIETYFGTVISGELQSVSSSHLYDALITSGRLVSLITQNTNKANFIKMIVEIEIPYLDNVDLKQLSEIFIDEYDKINLFRDVIFERFSEIEKSNGSEYLSMKIEAISSKLRREVQLLSTDYSNLMTKSSIQAAGAVLGSIMACLVAIDSSVFEAATKTIGLTGGLGVTLNSLQKYIVGKRIVNNNPHYFLWLLKHV